jgi:Leucine-rich repeat (LRR) protein
LVPGGPALGDDVIFPAGTNVTFTTGVGARQIFTLTVNGNAFVEFATGSATLTINSAICSVNGTSLLVMRGGNTLNLATGAGLTVNSNLQINGGTVSLNGTAVLNIAAGGTTSIATNVGSTLTLNGTSTVNIDGLLSLIGGVNSLLDISGGCTVNINNTGTLNNTAGAAGSVYLNSAAILQIVDNGTYLGFSPTYNTNSALRYTGTRAAYTIGTEWVTPLMNGIVAMNRAATDVISLPGNRTSGSNVTVQTGIFDTGNFALFLSGGTATFDLQAGATLRTTRTDGFNGTSQVTGAIQTAVGGTATYAATANYILDVVGGSQLNLGAQTGKQAITQANNFTIIINGGAVTAQLSSPLTLSGALNVSGTGQFDILAGASLTLNGAGSQVSSAFGIAVNNSTFVNNGGLTIASGSPFIVAHNLAAISGVPITYNVGSVLRYSIAGNRVSTATEFPVTMNGGVTLTNGAVGNTVTLNSNKTVNGQLTINTGTLSTGAGNSIALGFAGVNTIGASGVVNAGTAGTGNSFLTLQTGVTLTNSGQINVSNGLGGVSNVLELQGTSTIGGNNVIYSPTDTKLLYTGTVSATAGPEFPSVNGPANLTLNSPGGVLTLPAAKSLPVTGNLALSNGILDASAGGFTVNNPSTGAITHTVGGTWVVGALTRAVNAGTNAYSFPVGSSAIEYLGTALNETAAGAGTITVTPSASAGGKTASGALLTPFASQAVLIAPSVNLTAVDLTMYRFTSSFNLTASSLAEATAIGGTYTALPLNSVATNSIQTAAAATTIPSATPKYYAFASIPTTYYYHAPLGAPTAASSWTSIVGGLGTAAPGFNSGYTFVIPSGQTATYTLGANYTVPAGVTIQVNNGGTLEIDGDFNFNNATGTVTYMGATATLSYINGSGAGGTGLEFPNVMPGRVLVNRIPGTTFFLNQGKTVAGSTTFTGGDVWANGFTHIFNGAFTVNGGRYLDNGTTILAGAATMTSGRIFLSGSAYPLIVNGSLAISGGTLELNGVVSPQIDPASTGAVTFTGGVLQFSSSWSGIVNTKTLPISMPADVEILSGTPQIAANTTLSGNVTITTGSLTVNTGVVLSLAGSGSITTTGMNTINASAPGASIFTQRANLNGNWFASNSVFNLSIANAGGVTLTNNLAITNNLNFVTGIFTTSTGNTVNVSGIGITGGAANQFINGPAQLTFPASSVTTRIIPVGRGTSYLPVTLQNVTTGAPGPTVEVEAFNYPSGGTAVTLPLGNEYWRVQTITNAAQYTSGQLMLGTASPVVSASLIAYANLPTPNVTYSPILIPTTTVALGAINTVTTPLINGAIQNFVAITGAAPTTFYYQSGAAEILTNWNSNVNGSGSVPSSFATGNFYVPAGRTAPFTAMTLPIFASGTLLQIESGGAITIASGRTLTANGSFRVNAGGRLTLQGTGSVIAPSGVQYLAPTATLEYNAAVNRLTSSTEFPNIMPAQVEVHNGSVRLDASKQLQSTFLLNNSTMTFGAADRLRLSGSATFLGGNTGFVSDSTDTLIIDGSGTLAGTVSIPQLARLTMNRGGLPLTLAGTMQITQQLGLFGGNVSVPNGASVILQSSADTSLVGGNATSFVSGALVRQLLPNLTPTTTLPIFYPVGRGSTYLPLTLTEATTGTVAPQVSAEAFAVGAGGTPALGVPGALSTSEYWRLSAVSGSFTGARVGVLRGGITSMNTLASSLTQTGLYTSVGGTLSNLSQGLSLLSDGVSNSATRFYSIVGTLQGSPRVTGFTPSIGGEGTTMLITGTNLTGVNAIAIGGIAVSGFTVLSSTTISVVVGAVASGPIQVGSPLGGAASDSSFTFVPAPVIGGIFPNPAGIGTVITISGSNLGGLNSLQIGGVSIPPSGITVNADGSFTTRIPLTATTSTIILSTPGGTLISTTALTFVATPVLTSFSPAVSSTGAVITLLGQNFTQGTTVRFGDVFAQAVTVNSSGRMSVVVPPQAALLLASNGDKFGTLTSTVPNAVYLTVRTGGGTVTSATQFVYRPFPNGGTGSGVDPLRQVVVSEARDKLVSVGGLVRVTGANFELIQELTLRTSIGSTKANYILSSSAALTILIPTTGLLRSTTTSLSSALVTVDALGAFNQAIVQNLFTVVGVPTITAVQPLDAAAGEDVVVMGESLDLISGASLGGVSLPFRFVNGQVLVRIPSVDVGGVSLPGSGVLRFTSLGGIATTAAIINAALASGQPTILSFSPSGGGAGTTVVLTGVNFTRVTDALVGGVPVASFVINSSTQLTITLSGQTTSSSQGGITLLSPFGASVSLQPFVFSSSLAGDLEALERALSLTGVSLRDIDIERTDNRITSIGASNRPLNTSLEAFANALAPLTALRNLDLSNTGLTGAIPPSLARFTALESLNLSGNRLTGALVSDVVCSYRNLRLLDVSRNNLEGVIPVCIATLDKVRTLNLSQNRFSGGLPKELGGMVSLEELLVNNNRLTGGLPPEFGTPNGGSVKRTVRTASAQTLRVLDVSANELTGGIPAEWGGMSALQQLNVSNNRLSGALPGSIVNWESLQVLRLGNNRFVGEIPALSASQLTTLSLEQNRFTGRLPERLSQSRLKVLTVQGNGLVGLSALPRPTRIDTLRLDSNALEFGSLEPNREAPGLVYSPQDSIGSGGDTVVRVSSRLVIPSGIGGTKTVYEWLRNGRVLAGATSATLVLESAKAFQSGVYVCRATNSLLPKLTLFSRSYKLIVTGADQTLDAPELLFPPMQAENIAVRPRLKWGSVDGAEQYELTIGRDGQLRDVVLRRTVSVLAGSSEQSYRLEASDGVLERGGQYYWRVRALAVGSEGIPSEMRSFRVVPLGVDVGFSTIDAGRTLIGTQRRGDGVLVNVGTSAITLDSATAITNTDVFSLANQTRNVVMQVNEEVPINVNFTPKTAGEALASVQVWYKDAQQTPIQVRFDNALRGRGGALRVDEVNFDTIPVHRTILQTLRLVNLSRDTVDLLGLHLLPTNSSEASRNEVQAFQLESPLATTLLPQDTLLVTVRCTWPKEAVLRSQIQVFWRTGASIDSTSAVVRSVVSAENLNKPFVTVGVRARQDSLPPGSRVVLDVYIMEGNRESLFKAAQPEIRARVSFDPQVLSLVGGARQLRTASSTEAMVEVQTRWENLSGILATLECRAVAGERFRTGIVLRGLQWGKPEADRLPWEQAVIVAEPEVTTIATFTTLVSRAGGTRLIGTAKSRTIAVIPNPASGDVKIGYTLAEAGDVEITLLTASGEVVQTLAKEWREAGDYLLHADVGNVPSGAYRVVVHTRGSSIGEHLNIIR